MVKFYFVNNSGQAEIQLITVGGCCWTALSDDTVV